MAQSWDELGPLKLESYSGPNSLQLWLSCTIPDPKVVHPMEGLQRRPPKSKSHLKAALGASANNRLKNSIFTLPELFCCSRNTAARPQQLLTGELMLIKHCITHRNEASSGGGAIIETYGPTSHKQLVSIGTRFISTITSQATCQFNEGFMINFQS